MLKVKTLDPMQTCLKRRLAALLTIVLTTLSLTSPAVAEPSTEPWDQIHYNPKSADGDVRLPMPCGGQMVFRKILIPSTQPLDDFAITIGSTEQEWGFLESTAQAHIAGSFTENPDSHDNSGSGISGSDGDNSDKGARYFLMAKYETTKLQYTAVMTDDCDKPSIKARLPQTGVSWFDAVEFANRYTQWLQAQAPDALPREDDATGFLRLPTEVEWSFAARGGLAVSPSEFQDRVFPMQGAMNQYVWYSGPQSSNGKARPAGLLKPNPLGLHDILGNADEMIFEPFRLRTHGRSHGQAGGFVVRGGNYLTPSANIRSAWRVEQSYYRDGKPNTLPSTGFRLVVVAPAITSSERLQALEDQWLAMGSDPSRDSAVDADSADRENTGSAAANTSADASQQLAQLAAQAETKAAKQALNKVRDELRAANQRQREQRDRAVRSSLQLGGFFCAQLNQLARDIERRETFLVASCDPKNPRSSEKTCGNIKAVTQKTEASLQTMLKLYSDTIVELGSIYSVDAIETQAKVTAQALKSQQSLNLKPFVDGYVSDLIGYVENRKIQRQRWLSTCRAIVP